MEQGITMNELVALVNSRKGEFRINIEFGKEREDDGSKQREFKDSTNESLRT